MLVAQHQTHGVDIFVTPERLILIDCEPVDSASVVTRMLRLETPLSSECKTYEAMAHLMGLRLCLWMMSVCNTVLVVDDGLGLPSTHFIFRSTTLVS